MQVQENAATYGLLREFPRFAVVGASGYGINLFVYTVLLAAAVDYHAAATVAFAVALLNNFVWNKLWTFRAARGSARAQAFRFIVVSVGAFLLSLAVLDALVRMARVPKVGAEAVAVLAVTPLSFLANKLWSFRPQGL